MTAANTIVREDHHASVGNGKTQFAEGRALFGGGEVIPAGCDTSTALAVGGLDFEVDKRPLLVGHEGGCEWVDDFVATVRTDTEQVLGIVSPSYEPIQNADAFEVVEAGMVSTGAAQWVAGGTFRDGRRVWGMLELLQEYTAAGDPMKAHLLYINDHSGSRAITAMFTPVRIWCTNMMSLSMKASQRSISVRHIGDVEQRFAEAGSILSSADEYMGELVATADQLAGKRMSDRTLTRWLEQLYPAGNDDKATLKATDNRDAVRRMLGDSENLADHRENAWGFVNAVSEFTLWGRNRRDTGNSRVGQLVGGNSTDDALTNRALTIVSAN